MVSTLTLLFITLRFSSFLDCFFNNYYYISLESATASEVSHYFFIIDYYFNLLFSKDLTIPHFVLLLIPIFLPSSSQTYHFIHLFRHNNTKTTNSRFLELYQFFVCIIIIIIIYQGVFHIFTSWWWKVSLKRKRLYHYHFFIFTLFRRSDHFLYLWWV